MIKHKVQQDEAMSFFAFMSIISCAIGLLIFVLVGVTIVSFWGAEQVITDVRQSKDGRAGVGRIYVECRAEGLLVHPNKTVVSAADLEDPTRWLDSPYGECLSRLSGGKQAGSIFFLVRSDGLAVFRKALGYAFVAGGGTGEAVTEGRARFTMGHQIVTMPGPIRVVQREGEKAP